MKKKPFAWIDWLLLLTIAGSSLQLSVLFSKPAIEAWKNRPRPGVQVAQQCLVREGLNDKTQKVPIDYLLYLPQEYKTNAKWPLVVYLHGAGSQGHNLSLVRREGLPALVEHGKAFDFILLSPQYPEGLCWIPERVVDLIDHIAKTLSVDSDRIYLTGYSMGGNGTWDTACYAPDRFAAIAPLCGRSIVGYAERLTELPIWCFHGAKDAVIPLNESQVMVDAVRKHGGHVQFTVYPELGHNICETTYQNEQFYEWLLAQRRNQHSK